jgi:hypothetical protein
MLCLIYLIPCIYLFTAKVKIVNTMISSSRCGICNPSSTQAIFSRIRKIIAHLQQLDFMSELQIAQDYPCRRLCHFRNKLRHLFRLLLTAALVYLSRLIRVQYHIRPKHSLGHRAKTPFCFKPGRQDRRYLNPDRAYFPENEMLTN